jgi:acetyltransferase-like isoleucine patch superfamily enzyme
MGEHSPAGTLKHLANRISERMTLEGAIYVIYRWVYKALFFKLGKGSFVSPFIEHVGLDCIAVGEDSHISRRSRLLVWKQYRGQAFRPKICIGNNVYIGRGCTLSCANSINIEDDVTIGDGVYIADSNHVYSDATLGIRDQPLSLGSIHIAPRAWLGYGSFVAGNVTIGEHAVVGANSVVTKSVESYTVVAGTPAKPIKLYNHASGVWEIVVADK